MLGSGTQGDPYIIQNVTDLQAIENNLGSYYELEGNIDASATSGWNGNEGFVPISDFTGELDGKGYTISDPFINRLGLYRQAFIGRATNAVIQNVKLTGIDFTSDNGEDGGLVGYVDGTTTITNCSTTGTVASGGVSDYVGGLVGRLRAGTITNCWSSCTVSAGDDFCGGLIGYMDAGTVSKSYATGSVASGDAFAGGFIGYCDGGIIDDCYSRGNVSATGNYAGGFAGYTDSTLDDCYSTGTVSAASGAGGFCGWNDGGTVSNCFWDTETSGNATSDGGTGKTTSLMKAASTFTGAGWDFILIWFIDGVTNNGYPFLSIGVTIYPSDAQTRVTSLIHRFDRGTYTLELLLGEVTADFGLPEPESRPKPAFLDEQERETEQMLRRDKAIKERQEEAPSDEQVMREQDRRLWVARDTLREEEAGREEKMREQDRRLWAAADRQAEEQRAREEAQRREIEQMLAREEARKLKKMREQDRRLWEAAGQAPKSRAPLPSETLTEEQRRLLRGF